MKITSRDNSLLRRARAVRDGKEPASIFVEGLRLCEEGLASGLNIEAVIYSEEIIRKERPALLISTLENAGVKSASTSEKLLESISYTRTPQGIVVLASRLAEDKAPFAARQPAVPLLLVMHSINNPVNVGAIVRAAEAAGATGVIATKETADPFSAKALRGSMGSAFRVPIWTEVSYADVIDWCRECEVRTIGAAAKASTPFTEVNWRGSCALIVGPESIGLSSDEIAVADEVVRIPMKGSAESLNVAVATGILLYEANRQREGGA